MPGVLLDAEPVVLDALDFEVPCSAKYGDVRCEVPAEVALICRACRIGMAMLCAHHLQELRLIIERFCQGAECTACHFLAPDLDALAEIIPVREGSS